VSLYSYGGVPSGTPGQTALYPSRTYGSSTMPLPIAGAAGALGGPLLRAGAMGFLSNFLWELMSGGIRAATAGAAESLTPATTQGGSNSKFMLTLQDVRDIQQYADNENWRRRLTGQELLDPREMVRDREANLRRSAAEAGAREYAIEQLRQQGAVQSGLAQAAGTGSTALSEVIKQGIASTLNRPEYGTIMSEVGRAF
jgi:hypothetical protein